MIWDYLDYFDEDEKWGDSKLVNGFLLLGMDVLRRSCGWRFIVHNCYSLSGHSMQSEHHKANAIDGHFDTDVNYFDQIITVEKLLKELQFADRMGIGLYPVWKIPGFHFDLRGHKARWGWVGELKPDKTKEYCSYRTARLFAQSMGSG